MKIFILSYIALLGGSLTAAAAPPTSPLVGVWRPTAVDEASASLIQISYEVSEDGALTYTDGRGTALVMEMKLETQREFTVRVPQRAIEESVRVSKDGKELVRIVTVPGGKPPIVYQYERIAEAKTGKGAQALEGHWIWKEGIEKRAPEEFTITEEDGGIRFVSATHNMLVRDDAKGAEIRPQGRDDRSVRVSGRRNGERGLDLTVKRGNYVLARLEFKVAADDGDVMMMNGRYFTRTGQTHNEQIRYQRKVP